MKRQSLFIILIICIVIIIGGSIFFVKNNNFSLLQGQSSSAVPHAQPKNIYYTFPNIHPQFSVKINSKRTSTSSSYIRQQSISIYKIGHEKDKAIFQRSYKADGFNGDELTYIFATDSASFKQQGTLETLGCTQFDCSLQWSNFYTWDANKNTFVLDNASHTDDFSQLLTAYNVIDTKGCEVTDQNITTDQQGLSLSELYQQYPTLTSYCNKTKGIPSANLVFFLKAEKVIQEIVNGENVSSNDIKNTSL